MSGQNHMEEALRELYVLLSKCEIYDSEKSLIIVDKKAMIGALRELSESIYEVMDEYELTKQSRDQAEREVRKRGEEIIRDANKKAEDVYAASVMYTNEALKRVQYIMEDAAQSMKAACDRVNEDMQKEIRHIKTDQTELNGHLQDLADTNKYMQIIEERNKKILKEKKKEKEEAELPAFTSVKPEIRINEAYFKEHGLSLEEEPEPEKEKPEKVTAEINVNLDSEYFKWKEREANGGELPEYKRPEKKTLFGGLRKGDK